jgi:benzodiazapine receptor
MQHAFLVGLIGWIVLTFLTPVAGFQARPDAWYSRLNKPSWNPPSWIFGPVWTILYLLMAIAAWTVWTHGGWHRQSVPLAFYIVQLLLNAIWTPLFFGAHRPALAFIDIVLMWFAILVTAIAFTHVTIFAGCLLIPYIVWVSFATVLNFTLWRLNS